MAQINKLPSKPVDLTNFGIPFHQQLIAELVTNARFGAEIIDIIEPEYLKNEYFKFIVKLIKEYYKKYDVIPNYVALQTEIDGYFSGSPEIKTQVVDTLNTIIACQFDSQTVTETALKFCKFQSVRNAVDGIKKKLDGGYYDDYDEIELSIRKSITFRESDDGINFFTGLDSALADDYRSPIPTGIVGIDEITNGGLGKGELAVIIAPLGVGKTTVLSYIGSNGYLDGNNVLHIFFEDKIDEVRRKYLTHWSGIPLGELNKNREVVLQKAEKVKTENSTGNLVLQKLNADSTTIAKRRRVIKREKSKLGGKLDLVIIDYADVIVGEQNKESEEWIGEGRTMRQLEMIADEFNVALWTAAQGGRKSTTAAVVEVDMIGGNIKKAQVAHFIMSIAKTLQQRDQKLATIAILKSRFGDDGKLFENCSFDNSRMIIDTTTLQSFDMFREEQNSKNALKVRAITMNLRALNNSAEENNTNQ